MGKATGVGSIVFGIFMIIFAIGAYFSGEEASQTDQGRIAIGIVILLGLGLIYGGVDARTKVAKTTQAPAQQTVQVVQTADVPPPPPDAVSTVGCQSCGRAIQPDFRVCPFCGKPTKPSCPKCGKQVEHEYAVCPYCGTTLKSG